MKILGRKEQRECYTNIMSLRKISLAFFRLCDPFTEEADRLCRESSESVINLLGIICGIKGLNMALDEFEKELKEIEERTIEDEQNKFI